METVRGTSLIDLDPTLATRCEVAAPDVVGRSHAGRVETRDLMGFDYDRHLDAPIGKSTVHTTSEPQSFGAR